MTPAQWKTLKVCAWIAAGILLWDLFLVLNGIPSDTISGASKTAALEGFVTLPLLYGIWMGHMWWYQSGKENRTWLRRIGFAAIILGSYLWWRFTDDPAASILAQRPEIAFVLGYVAGHYVWPQYEGEVGA